MLKNLMSKLKAISILALLAGPFIIVMTYIDTSEKQRIDREGVQVAATPIAKIERRGRRGGRSYKIEIRFSAEGSGIRTENVRVSRELYERLESIPSVQIKYLREDPSKIIVVGEPLDSAMMYPIGLGIVGLGLLGSWWFFVRKRALPAAQIQRT